MRKYKCYTDADIIAHAKESVSIAGLLVRLDLKPVGGNYINIKKHLSRLNIDTNHWTGRAWNKGQQLKDYSKYTKIQHLKKHLISDRSHQCQSCENTEWLGIPIMLEVDHIDGDRTNNSEDNLKLLCPNCHAQTPTWRNRKRN